MCCKFISSNVIPYEFVPAFRWKNGKLLGLSLNGETGNDKEYLYVHLQKRVMKFTPNLEHDNSFMIIPNEFVKDHGLTQEEIQEFIKPDPAYDSAHKKNIKYYIKKFFSFDTRGKLIKIILRLYTKFGIIKPLFMDNDI